MRTILFIIQKEFLQIFRNKTMLPMLLLVPVIQLLVLTYAVTFELKKVRMHIVDNDLSTASRNLVSKFEGSPFYEISSRSFSMQQAEEDLLANRTDVVLNIPSGFEQDLYRGTPKKLQLIVSAINSNVAALSTAYTSMVLADYNSGLGLELSGTTGGNRFQTIRTTYSFWYNTEMDYTLFMAPGILVMLITTIGLFLSGMNIVREKELGTIEQINVTPIGKLQFIAGKLTPFMIIGIVDLFIGLAFAKILFDIPIVGSVGVVLCFTVVYLFALLGLGLLISTWVNTQQQALFLTWFFLVVFILMSGLFTPVESMPEWAQYLNYFNPVAYFIRVMRMVLMKGSGFADTAQEFWMLGTFGVLIFAAAVRRYRKTT